MLFFHVSLLSMIPVHLHSPSLCWVQYLLICNWRYCLQLCCIAGKLFDGWWMHLWGCSWAWALVRGWAFRGWKLPAHRSRAERRCHLWTSPQGPTRRETQGDPLTDVGNCVRVGCVFPRSPFSHCSLCTLQLDNFLVSYLTLLSSHRCFTPAVLQRIRGIFR